VIKTVVMKQSVNIANTMLSNVADCYYQMTFYWGKINYHKHHSARFRWWSSFVFIWISSMAFCFL